MFSVVMGMRNSNWPASDAWYYLTSRENAGGAYLQEQAQRCGVAKAHRSFLRAWNRAGSIVHDRPAAPRPLERVALLIEARALTDSQPALFSCGIAGTTERAVLRAIIARGLASSSLIVSYSESELALEVLCEDKTVRAALRRLIAADQLLVEHQRYTRMTSTVYRVRLPSAGVVTGMSFAEAGGGQECPVVMPARVGRLFGPTGLGLGAMETFAALPLLEVPGHAGLQVVGRSGTPRYWRDHARDGREPLSGVPTALRGPGRETSLISELTGKNPRTVRRDLMLLRRAGIALSIDQVHYRLAFDPDAVCDELNIPSVREARTVQRTLEVERHLDGLVNARQIRVITQPDGVVYVDPRSGATRRRPLPVTMTDAVKAVELLRSARRASAVRRPRQTCQSTTKLGLPCQRPVACTGRCATHRKTQRST
jgi:hypothetical protein